MWIRELNRQIQNFLRPKRIALGRLFWDRKTKSSSNTHIINKTDMIKTEKIKSILFIRNDGKIGDMIINSLMFREIKKKYPNVFIGVVTRGANREVIINNPHVNKIYNYSKSDSELRKLANDIALEKYDLLIDFSEMLRVKQMKFINLCAARINMGLNKSNWKLFDVSVEYRVLDKHISDRYKNFLNILGVKNPELSYDVYFSEENLNFGLEFKKRIKEKKIVCINPYGASKYRTLNEKKIIEITNMILKGGDTAVTFVYSPDKLIELKKIVEELDTKGIYLNENINTILDSASILKVCDFIITPDTSIVHLGVALEKKMAVIYRSDKGAEELNSIVWGPNSTEVKQIYAKQYVSKNEESDINEFDIEEIKLKSKGIF